jgi:hypothetical protein
MAETRNLRDLTSPAGVTRRERAAGKTHRGHHRVHALAVTRFGRTAVGVVRRGRAERRVREFLDWRWQPARGDRSAESRHRRYPGHENRNPPGRRTPDGHAADGHAGMHSQHERGDGRCFSGELLLASRAGRGLEHACQQLLSRRISRLIVITGQATSAPGKTARPHRVTPHSSGSAASRAPSTRSARCTATRTVPGRLPTIRATWSASRPTTTRSMSTSA